MDERSREPVLVRVKRVGAIAVPFPRYQTSGAAGMDLHAALGEAAILDPRARLKVPTGLSVAIPHSELPVVSRARIQRLAGIFNLKYLSG